MGDRQSLLTLSYDIPTSWHIQQIWKQTLMFQIFVEPKIIPLKTLFISIQRSLYLLRAVGSRLKALMACAISLTCLRAKHRKRIMAERHNNQANICLQESQQVCLQSCKKNGLLIVVPTVQYVCLLSFTSRIGTGRAEYTRPTQCTIVMRI